MAEEPDTPAPPVPEHGPEATTGEGEAPTPYLFRVEVPVRFRDIDVGAHAHHSHALAYFEEARWRYWTEVAGREARAEGVDYILAEACLRYRARILYPDSLSVGVRAESVGRTHVELAYEIRTGQDQVAVTGSTILVMYDYVVGRTMPVPADLRTRLERHEGRTLPRRMDPSRKA
jgi:acyl-CoA thioester hydrolase